MKILQLSYGFPNNADIFNRRHIGIVRKIDTSDSQNTFKIRAVSLDNSVNILELFKTSSRKLPVWGKTISPVGKQNPATKGLG